MKNQNYSYLLETFERIKESNPDLIQHIIHNKDVFIIEFFPKINSDIITNLKTYIESNFKLRCIIAEIPKFQHDQKYNFRIVRYDLIVYSRDINSTIFPKFQEDSDIDLAL